jgi:hypothetical protein
LLIFGQFVRRDGRHVKTGAFFDSAESMGKRKKPPSQGANLSASVDPAGLMQPLERFGAQAEPVSNA